MGKLILVRHGESEANRQRIFAPDDSPLTEFGRGQAREVARRIAARFRPDRAVSSDFLRARQTAEILAAELGIELAVAPELRERDFGPLTGLPYEAYEDLARRDPDFNPKQPWRWTPPGGESTDDVGRRVIPFLDALRARYTAEEVLVVCHGVVMLSVWAHLRGTWEGIELPPNCAVLSLENSNGRLAVPVLLEDCLVAQE
jgi:broad specificity phosphatase PhoE